MAKDTIQQLLDQSKRDLMARRDAFQAALDDIDKKSAPLHKQRDAAFSRIAEIDREVADLTVQIKEVETDRFAVANELGTIARALGGRSTSQNTGDEAPAQ